MQKALAQEHANERGDFNFYLMDSSEKNAGVLNFLH